MIYLDNAATSFPKPSTVTAAVEECIKKYCSNSGRSAHTLAIKTSEEIFLARESVSSFFCQDNPQNVCFTQNATYAINIALKGLITKKCHVLISDVEHNSILRPLNTLKESIGISYSTFSTDGDIRENILKSIKKDTKVIASTLCSNVTGIEIPIEILSTIAKERGLILIVDASQLAGHKKINLKRYPCDALCAPGHKGLLGIQGVGFAFFKSKTTIKTIIEGGSGNESQNLFMPHALPERLEAGTLPTPSIVALRAGIEHLNNFGLDEVSYKIGMLTDFFTERLSALKKIKICGADNGIISFSVANIPSSVISDKLNSSFICTRSGLHCAPLAHKKLGTLKNGLVRISLSIFNTKAEADILYKALVDICNGI